MYELETERTVLRIPVLNDLDALADIFGSPQVMRYMDVECKPLTREQTEIALVSIIEGWKKNGFGRWSVISKENDKLIGLAGMRKHEDVAELFYVLEEAQWGKGLATEIAGEILRAGFKEHDFNRIVALTRPTNVASRKVMSKLQMTFIGESVFYGIEAVQYSITREKFRSTYI